MTLSVDELIERLWNNPEDMQKFEAAPKQFLIDNGEPIPDDVQVYAHIDTPSAVHFVLPEDGADIPEGDNLGLEIVRKAIDNETYKAQLIENPKAALAQDEIDIPDDVDVNIYQDTPSEVHIVVPFNPATGELSGADLDAVAGGAISKRRRAEAVKQCNYLSKGSKVACKFIPHRGAKKALTYFFKGNFYIVTTNTKYGSPDGYYSMRGPWGGSNPHYQRQYSDKYRPQRRS